MKRLFPRSFVLSIALSLLTSLTVNAFPTLVPLQIGFDDPIDEHDSHRGPVNVPNLVIDNYNLQIPEFFNGYSLRIVDENGVVVYFTIIPEGCEEILLPSNLSGDYQIQLYNDSIYYYYGEITL